MQKILKSESFWAALIFIVAIGLYAGTFSHDYNLDDNLVTQNHRLTSKGISAIPDIIDSYYYEDEMGYKYGYRPLVHISFAIEHSLFEEKASTSHIINVFLYAIVCLLVFYFVRKLAPDKPLYFAFIAAILFVVHPIHTEVVASIKNRDEILSLLFGLLACISVLSLRDVKSIWKQVLLWVLALGFFYLGILSKNSIVPLALGIPLLYVFFVERKWHVFPFVFLVVANMLFLSILTIEVLELAIFQVACVAALLFVYSLYKKNRIYFVEQPQRQKMVIIIGVLLFSIVAFLIGLLLKTSIFILLGFSIPLLVLNLVEMDNVKELSSFTIFLLLSFIGMYEAVLGLIVLGFIFFLLLNQSIIKKYKWKFLPVLLAALLFVTISNRFGLPTGIEIYLIVLYFINVYFPIAMVLPVLTYGIQFALGAKSFLFPMASLMAYLLFLQERFVKTNKRWLKKGFLFLMSVLLLVSFYQFYKKITIQFYEEEQIQILEESSLYVSENAIDRPILYTENPLVENWEPMSRLSAAATSTMFYLKKMTLPYPLLFYYGYDQVEIPTYQSPSFYLAALFLFALIVAALWLFPKHKILSISILATLLFLFPYSNFVTPVPGIVAERLTFVASLFFCIGLAVLFYYFIEKSKKQKITASLVLGLLVWSSIFYTIYRADLWKKPMTLYEHDIFFLEKSAVANSIIGEYYLGQAQVIQELESPERYQYTDDAIHYLTNSTLIHQDDYNNFYYLGIANYMKGNFWPSQKAFEESYKIDSSYLADPYLHMARWAVDLGFDSIAIDNYNNYIKLIDSDEQAYFELLSIYVEKKQYDKAINLLLKMDVIFHDNLLVCYNLYEIARKTGEHSIAQFYYDKGMKIDEMIFQSYLY